MNKLLCTSLSALFLLQGHYLFGQIDSVHIINKKRLFTTSIAVGTAYTASMVALDKIWYHNTPRTSFHFFNDNREWNQLDKLGHFYTSFYISTYGIDLLRWGGVSQKKAIIIDNALGLLLLTPIEIMDGYSSQYGASWGDELADASGDIFVLGQYLLWNQIRLYPKFSFHPTAFASLHSNVLGNNLLEQIIKDYNGQTYWLSIPIRAFVFQKSKLPKWLSISIGYGASNMVYGDPGLNTQHGFNSYRQFYISPDLNLKSLKVKSKFLKTALNIIDMIHLPLPAIEFNSKKGFVFHPIHF